jgi:hypothetical protein
MRKLNRRADTLPGLVLPTGDAHAAANDLNDPFGKIPASARAKHWKPMKRPFML